MPGVKACVLCGFGINCDYETQFALEKAGAQAEAVHINDFISGKRLLSEFSILVFPGGFSFGDDIGSGKVLANMFKFNLKEQLEKFIEEKKLIMGICNGFQSLVKMGLLPALGKNFFTQTATLTFNDSGKFEDRWVHLKFNKKSHCVFAQGIGQLYLPVRHGEGKFIAQNNDIMERIFEKELVVAQYVDERGEIAGYPWNPNGSQENIAAICDETGRIFGIMPHPEAFNHFTNHPRWSRKETNGTGDGLQVFRNAVEFAGQNLI